MLADTKLFVSTQLDPFHENHPSDIKLESNITNNFTIKSPIIQHPGSAVHNKDIKSFNFDDNEE